MPPRLASDIVNITICWFRKDLRLYDNPALYHAIRDSHHVVLLYIYQEALPDAGIWKMGSAQKWWLHHSLLSLGNSLKSSQGSQDALLLKQGHAIDVFESIFSHKKDYTINALYYNKVYEPWAGEQEKLLQILCEKHGVRVSSFNASLLLEPDQVMNRTGTYFKVFTPYWRACCERIATQQAGPHPRKLYDRPTLKPCSAQIYESITKAMGGCDALSDWALLPTHPDWAGGLRATWKVSETEAQAQLKNFTDGAGLRNYNEGRDQPFLAGGTSRMSPYLALGQVGPWQVWYATKPAFHDVSRQGRERFLSELGWREFSYYLLHHFPTFAEANYRPEFDRFEWATSTVASQSQLRAWQRGQTGYPLVDAGMRQIWYEGYMHNRVRMVTASFLTKDLLVDWRTGAAWFWDTLVDADMANNANGWQWVAGSGADASPYFRIFNPVLQGQKFDPDGSYVKKWIPALANLPPKYVHQPWTCPAPILAKAGLTLGADYPLPIVNHEKCRARALEYYQRLKNAPPTTGPKKLKEDIEDQPRVTAKVTAPKKNPTRNNRAKMVK